MSGRSRPIAQCLSLGGAIAALFALGACNRSPVTSSLLPPEPLPQDPEIAVYFNHNRSRGATYSEPYRQLARTGDDLEQVIVDEIAAAERQIDVAIQEFRLPKIAQALADRHRAGVQVRVIIENSYNRPWSEVDEAEAARLEPRDRGAYLQARELLDLDGNGTISATEASQRDALIILREAGVPLIDDTEDDSKGSGLMHHKFIVIDGEAIVTGSANFTTSGIHGDFGNLETRGNANNILVIRSSQLAAAFSEEFELMWGDGPGGAPDSLFGVKKPSRSYAPIAVGEGTIAVQFSPTSTASPWDESSNGVIARALSTAEESILLALFVFSDQGIVNAIADRHRSGVEVAAIIDSSFAYRSYSEGLDMLGVALATKDCKYETDNQPWKPAIDSVGIPTLAKGDKLHHKFGIVDDEVVVTGSHNWSASANHQNDETVLVIEHPGVVAHFRREFDRLYETALLGVPIRLAERIEKQQQTCGEIETVRSDAPPAIVNINTASAQDLETLPGIGPTLAERIIAEREKRPFTSLEDLERVSGIGPTKASQLDGLVRW